MEQAFLLSIQLQQELFQEFAEDLNVMERESTIPRINQQVLFTQSNHISNYIEIQMV